MKHILFIVFLASIFSGCIKENSDPSWITINKWTIEQNPNGNDAGVLTNNFPYAWVYVNNDLLGVFELPCTVPVLTSGAVEIRVYPTILNNGISATKKIYPFVESQTIYANLVQNETFEINPVTRYLASTVFIIEDFEGPNMAISDGSNSIASMLKEGDANNSYGRVLLNSSQNYWEGYWNPAQHLETGSATYLEIDYYNTNDIVQGLLIEKSDGTTSSQANIQMNQQKDSEVHWKKIYIELNEIVNYSQGYYFLQTFQASLDELDSEGLIYIDNLKIVHF